MPCRSGWLILGKITSRTASAVFFASEGFSRSPIRSSSFSQANCSSVTCRLVASGSNAWPPDRSINSRRVRKLVWLFRAKSRSAVVTRASVVELPGLVHDDGATPTELPTYSWKYDAAGWMTEMKIDSVDTAGYIYDNLGQLTSTDYTGDWELAAEDDQGDVLWGLADHEGTIRDVYEYGNPTPLVDHREYDTFGRLARDRLIQPATYEKIPRGQTVYELACGERPKAH